MSTPLTVRQLQLVGLGWNPVSYVTDDKIYCVYVAPDKDIIAEHARCGGFPATVITEVAAVIDPSTGD